MSKKIFIGTDSGATTTKFSAVWENGEAVTTKCCSARPIPRKAAKRSSRRGSPASPKFSPRNNCPGHRCKAWACPFPGLTNVRRLGQQAQPTRQLCGWDVYNDYRPALAAKSGRPLQLVAAMTAITAAWPRHRSRAARPTPPRPCSCRVRVSARHWSADGLSLDGDTLAGMEAGHMAAPVHLLGMTGKPFTCGCGRDWGCVEAYTAISGLPQ